jgi:hypothetical protein
MRDTKNYGSKTLKGRNLAWLVATLILDFLVLLVLAFHTAIEDLTPTRLAAVRASPDRTVADPGVDLLVADLGRPQGHPRILALQASVAGFACLFRARAGGSPHRPDEAEKERRRVPCG